MSFGAYLGLGPERNLRDLRAVLVNRRRQGGKCAPSLRTLESWSSRFGWQERVAAIERRARQEHEQQHVEWVLEHRERLRTQGQLLQDKGVEWLNAKMNKDVSATEAIRAIDAGSKLQALALGEVTSRIAVEDEDERLRGLTDDELEQLLRQVRAHTAAHRAPARKEESG